MKRKFLLLLAGAGFLAAAVLVVIVFVMLPRFQRMNASGYGPRMMGGGGQTPGGLHAVSAQGTPAAPPANSAALPENTAAQTVGGLTISLALSPYPPLSFQQAKFDVTVKDETGQAVTDAVISLDLTMPAMPMPVNVVDAAHSENGLYQGAGRFTMRGLWRIEVIVERGAEKTSAFFDVGL